MCLCLCCNVFFDFKLALYTNCIRCMCTARSHVLFWFSSVSLSLSLSDSESASLDALGLAFLSSRVLNIDSLLIADVIASLDSAGSSQSKAPAVPEPLSLLDGPRSLPSAYFVSVPSYNSGGLANGQGTRKVLPVVFAVDRKQTTAATTITMVESTGWFVFLSLLLRSCILLVMLPLCGWFIRHSLISVLPSCFICVCLCARCSVRAHSIRSVASPGSRSRPHGRRGSPGTVFAVDQVKPQHGALSFVDALVAVIHLHSHKTA